MSWGRGLLALTLLWLGLEGYPQWLRWQEARLEVARIRRSTLEFEETLKYIPTLRRSLMARPETKPTLLPEAPSAVQVSFKRERLSSPTSPPRLLSGLQLSVAGPTAEVLGWLNQLARQAPVQRLRFQRRGGKVEGRIWVLVL